MPHAFLSILASTAFLVLVTYTSNFLTCKVIGYFAFLGALIAIPFVGGTMDTFRISEFREKRQVCVGNRANMSFS